LKSLGIDWHTVGIMNKCILPSRSTSGQELFKHLCLCNTIAHTRKQNKEQTVLHCLNIFFWIRFAELFRQIDECIYINFNIVFAFFLGPVIIIYIFIE